MSSPEDKREWRRRFPLKIAAYKPVKRKNDAAYRERHADEIRARKRLWNAANLGKKRADNAKRKAAKRQRTPKWLTRDDYRAIKAFYVACPEGFHVDHVLPLLGQDVSGLHVLSNLQYLPATENLRKGNRCIW